MSKHLLIRDETVGHQIDVVADLPQLEAVGGLDPMMVLAFGDAPDPAHQLAHRLGLSDGLPVSAHQLLQSLRPSPGHGKASQASA